MTRLLPAAALALLAACNGEPAAPVPANDIAAEQAQPRPASDPRPAPPQPVPSGSSLSADGTTGGEGSAIELAALRGDDAEGVQGELGCGFARERGGPSILIARADVGRDARAQGVIRLGDYPERLAAREAGGFGALERGISLAGRGMTVTVTPRERMTGGEAPVRSAQLLAQRGDGAQRVFEGFWTCGP